MSIYHKFLEEFIECYQKNTVLWNTSHSDYLTRSKKEYGYNELLEIWEKYKGYSTIDDVKKQIYSLRCRYRKELRRTILAEQNGKKYEPNLWAFPLLNFLRDVIVFDKNSLTAEEKSFLDTLAPSSETLQNEEKRVENKRDSPHVKCASQKQFMQEFIDCYKIHPLLWNPGHPDYHSHQLKAEAFAKLLEIIKQHCGAISTIYDVKKQIHSIRSTYKRELAKQASDSGYISKVWWLPLAAFLSQSEKNSNTAEIEIAETDASIDETGKTEDISSEDHPSAANASNATELSQAACSHPKEFLKEFLQCYGSNPVLWDKQHSQYRCRRSKKAAYIKLKTIYKKYYGQNGSYDDIRSRIHSIRSAYRREYTKHRADPNYTPELWWYPLAEFLGNQRMRHAHDKVVDESQPMAIEIVLKPEAEELQFTDRSVLENIEEVVEVSPQSLKRKEPSENNGAIITETVTQTTEEIENKCSASNGSKPKIKLSKNDQMFLRYYEKQGQDMDTYDKMAKIWADKLRNMHKLQRQYAVQAINEILFQAELNKLNYEFVQKIGSHID